MKTPLSKTDILNNVDIFKDVVLGELLSFIDFENVNFLVLVHAKHRVPNLVNDTGSSHNLTKIIIIDPFCPSEHRLVFSGERILNIVVD
jgi:hypothetical protein